MPWSVAIVRAMRNSDGFLLYLVDSVRRMHKMDRWKASTVNYAR
jgi:hypothetical protein